MPGASSSELRRFENTYALAMRLRHAEAAGIHRIGDLTPHARQLVIGGDYEFFGRPEWIAIRDAYRLAFASERTMDPSLMYQAVAGEQGDVISAYSTDGRIAALDLVVLEDDRRAIPPYDALVLVGPRLIREHPDAVAALRQIARTIDADRMRRMNLAVDQDAQVQRPSPSRFCRKCQPGLPSDRISAALKW